MEVISILDFILPPLFLVILLVYAGIVKNKHMRINPSYAYFQKAIIIKVIGGICFGLVYVFYYGGGDTLNYFQTAGCIENLLFHDLDTFNSFFFTKHTEDVSGYFFNQHTGYPIFRINDSAAIFTSKFYVPIIMISGNSYLAASIVAAYVSFTGLWRMYLVFTEEFPKLRRELFIAIFAIPSVFFWGSGIMKDSIIISAIGWYVYAFYWFFIRKKRKTRLLLFLLISSFLMISVKPYVLFALLPGSIIWLSNQYAMRFTSKALRRIFTPILLVIGLSVAFIVLQQLDDMLGLYKIDSVAERASIVSKDLKMDYYGGKSFNIGDYDPSLAGMMSVAHKAIFAALFRPSILDVQNVMMLLSALENTYILLLTIVLMWRLRIRGFIKYVQSHPLLLFSVMFSLFFAFSVGISISNFGSLVRLRIPALPFFVSALFIIKYYYQENNKVKLRI